MSTFPIIPAFPADGDPAFNAKARAVMDALATGSVEANAAFGQLAAAMTTLEASVNATVRPERCTSDRPNSVSSPRTACMTAA